MAGKIALGLSALALGGCLAPPEFKEVQNRPPEAGLRAPVIAPVGVPVPLDASGAVDPDGDPLTYRVEIFGHVGSGGPVITESVTPVFEVLLPAEGLFTVELTVRDPFGGEGKAFQDVAARLDYPDPPGFCSDPSDCPVGDECTDGVCFVSGGAVP